MGNSEGLLLIDSGLRKRLPSFSAITEAYLCMMLTLFPVFTGLDGYIRLTEKKFLFFAIVSGVWLLLLFLIRILNGGVPARRPPLEIGVFAAAVTVSSAVSGAFFLAMEGERCDGPLTWLLYAICLAGVIRFRRVTPRLFLGVVLSYTFCCAVAICQLLGWNALSLYPWDLNYYDPYVQETGKFLGMLGNVDVFSAFHCLVIPLLIGGLVYGREKMRFLLVIPLVLGILCIWKAEVASGILALLLTAVLWLSRVALCRLACRHSLSHQKQTLLWLMAVAAILLVAALLVFLIPVGSGSIYELHQLLRENMDERFGSSRVQIWRDAWRVAKDHLLIGIGPDRFEGYTQVRFERYSTALDCPLVAIPDNAHNEYLQLLLCFGLFGTIPALLLLARTLIGFLRKEHPSAQQQVMMASFVCYLIQAFFNIGSCIITPIFAILWGLLWPMTRTSDTKQLEP